MKSLENALVTVQTYLGFTVDLLAPKAKDIELADIAHSLSQQCRFNGHTKRFYSVAEHSIYVSRLCLDWDLARIGLLHDAAEAYIGDIVKPFRDTIGDWYLTVESKLNEAIGERFDCDLRSLPQSVQEADLAMAIEEHRQLFSGDKVLPEKDPGIDATQILKDGKLWCAWPPDAEVAFVRRAIELGIR